MHFLALKHANIFYSFTLNKSTNLKIGTWTSSILTGDKGTENVAVDQQSSTEVPNQETGPAAVSGDGEELSEEEPSPPSEGSCQQNSSHQSEEEPETPDSEVCNDGDQSQDTIDLTALTSPQPKEEECLSDCPPTAPDVSTRHLSDLSHSQETLENSGGGEGESDKCTDGVETVETECIIITEENTDIAASADAAAVSSPEEQEDDRSHQETELSEETDVCVCQEILE